MNITNSDTDPSPTGEYIRDALHEAVSLVLDKDFELLAIGSHEQSIAHRLAVYLESYFPRFHTDCEYNRWLDEPKRGRSGSDVRDLLMRPDIVVHRRNSALNILAIEVKANGNEERATDDRKLDVYVRDSRFRYHAAASVVFCNSLGEIREGQLRAEISLSGLTLDGNEDASGHKRQICCGRHAAEVMQIATRQQNRRP